jgi:cell division transport system permease protein
MSKLLSNLGYVFQEVKTILRLNGISSLLSLFSLTLIFFVAILAMSSWQISTSLVQALENEAEISVYYDAARVESGDLDLSNLISQIESADGTLSALPISAEDAYIQMSGILGQDAAVLNHFDENPFEPYLEVGIDLNKLSEVIDEIKVLDGVAYVRDNQTVLEKVAAIAGVVSGIGIFVALAVGLATLMVTSHIIREGVHSNREQIMTLKLLGAPNGFIYQPYVMGGVLLTTLAGLLAAGLFLWFVRVVSADLAEVITFLPPVNVDGMISMTLWGAAAASFVLGLAASLLGLSMIRNHGMRV